MINKIKVQRSLSRTKRLPSRLTSQITLLTNISKMSSCEWVINEKWINKTKQRMV